MRRFSERHGLIQAREAFQRGSIDSRLRNRLWSATHEIFWQEFGFYVSDDQVARFVFSRIWDGFFGKPVDEMSHRSDRNISFLKESILENKWNTFYDFIQFIADFSKISGNGDPQSHVRMLGEIFISRCNTTLSAEKSAYRFVSGELCEITDENEIAEIEIATRPSDSFASARSHLSTALMLYASRDFPDYRNSIKEAISAVESAFSTINGERSTSMAKAVTLAEKNGLTLHSALKEGILRIYGWTSDEAGVRHALFEGDSSVGEAHARFMLVTCSSLINFLVSISGQSIKLAPGGP